MPSPRSDSRAHAPASVLASPLLDMRHRQFDDDPVSAMRSSFLVLAACLLFSGSALSATQPLESIQSAAEDFARA